MVTTTEEEAGLRAVTNYEGYDEVQILLNRDNPQGHTQANMEIRNVSQGSAIKFEDNITLEGNNVKMRTPNGLPSSIDFGGFLIPRLDVSQEELQEVLLEYIPTVPNAIIGRFLIVGGTLSLWINNNGNIENTTL